MKNIVIIKLYKNEITSGDYHDLMLDEFEQKYNEAKEFAKNKDKELYFNIINCEDVINADGFAEIEYNTSLDEEEKEYYKELIKYFSYDAEIENRTLNTYSTLKRIILKKINCEFV